MTVAELRNILAGMPDDALVLMPNRHNYPIQRYGLVRHAEAADMRDDEGAAEYVREADNTWPLAGRHHAVILRI